MFHTAGEHMGQLAGAAGFGRFHCGAGGGFAPFPLERADFQRLTAHSLAEFFQINPFPVLVYQVDHVDRHDHRDAQFNELRGQVEVALDVCAIDNVQNGIGLFPHQIAAGHHFLQGIGGQRIDARKILDHHLPVAFEATFLFFHRDAGPVAHILIGTGQRIEQRCLAAVRVAGQSDF